MSPSDTLLPAVADGRSYNLFRGSHHLRKSWAQLYAPFLVLIAIQGMFIAVAPSRTATSSVSSGGSFQAGEGGTLGEGFTDTGEGLEGSPGVEGFTPGEGGATGSTGAGATGGGTAAGATRGTGTSAGGGVPGVPTTGDTSHCKGELQVQVLLNANPPCVPKFTGDNGGETSPGVSGDKIKVVIFSAKPNEQVDAILATQGLAVPKEESQAFWRAAFKYVEKHYEQYGRTFDIQFVEGDCPTTPPDYDQCNAEAQQVVKLEPFAVIWNTPLYASVFDIWAKAGIVALGGWQFDSVFFNERRPFRYDPWMNGTELGAHLAEYYCKKMAGQKATHSGTTIYPTIGRRGEVDRKLGIVTPEIEANVLAAKRVAATVKSCGGGDVPIFTYESDIQRATEQTQATVSGLIQAKVTTVTCMCDPIAPTFLTSGMSGNQYYPEFLIPGTQFMDADLVGRLYDKQAMSHAFGISLIPNQMPLDQADPTRVWRDVGNSGIPCGKSNCGTSWPYANMLGWGVHLAGPNLTPATFERALLTSKQAGGWSATQRGEVGLWKLGQDDYTWLSDMREVYWDPNATSPVDGSGGGAYVSINKGRRYVLGEWPNKKGLDGIPVAPN